MSNLNTLRMRLLSGTFVPATTLRAPPSGFVWGGTPFQVFRRGDGTFYTTYNINTNQPTITGTIYVGPAGNNANNGLTPATKVKSLSTAGTKANALTGVVNIIADPAEYLQSAGDAWNNMSPNNSVTWVITPSSAGRVISVQDCVMPAFTLAFTNIYVSAYTTETPAAAVIDRAFPTPDGYPTMLWVVPSVAVRADPSPEMNAAFAARGSAAYLDTVNKKLYVRLPNNRAPDASVTVTTNSNVGFSIATGTNRRVWMQDCSFWGGRAFTVSSTGTGMRIWGLRAHYLYASFSTAAGGFSGNGSSDDFAYHVDSIASWNGLDGFNYHTAMQFFEERCKSDFNGWAGGGANNGTTCHDNCVGIRVQGQALSNYDRSVHDINLAKTWNLGITAGPSINEGLGNSLFNFGSGFAGLTGTTMWLDGCVSVPGNDFDLEVASGSTMYYADMDISGYNNSVAGTLAAYTP